MYGEPRRRPLEIDLSTLQIQSGFEPHELERHTAFGASNRQVHHELAGIFKPINCGLNRKIFVITHS
jgi:hypothetical protein